METDLVRTLKQLINARSIKAQQQQDQSSVTIFGQKLTAAKIEDQEQVEQPQPGSEKLPPTAILHLKELYEQHIKKRKARYVENGDALATLPLLNAIQDKENVGIKRQRTGPVLDRFSVSSSQQAPSCFPAPPAAAAFEEMEEDPSRNETEKAASLTVFYNGLVYVYEDIPADKAQAIMVLAGNSSTASSSRTVSSDTTSAGTPPKASAPVKRAFSLADLPQARKASLQRFLVKRKERLVITSDKMKRKSPPKSSKVYIEEAGLVLGQ